MTDTADVIFVEVGSSSVVTYSFNDLAERLRVTAYSDDPLGTLYVTQDASGDAPTLVPVTYRTRSQEIVDGGDWLIVRVDLFRLADLPAGPPLASLTYRIDGRA